MATYYVTCAVRDGADPGRRIDALDANGTRYPIDDVIRMIEDGDEFFTRVPGFPERKIHVYRRGLLSVPFLSTSPDEFGENNLGELPDCPRPRGLFGNR